MSNSGSPDKKRKSENARLENVEEPAAKRLKTGDATEQRKESSQKPAAPKKVVPDEDSDDFAPNKEAGDDSFDEDLDAEESEGHGDAEIDLEAYKKWKEANPDLADELDDEEGFDDDEGFEDELEEGDEESSDN